MTPCTTYQTTRPVDPQVPTGHHIRHLRTPTKEPPHGHCRAQHNSRESTANDRRAEKNVHHLHAISPAAAIDKTIRVVGTRELLALGNGHFEEVGERLPAFAHLVFEKVVRRHEGADFVVVFVEAGFAILLKVAIPELGPEFC